MSDNINSNNDNNYFYSKTSSKKLSSISSSQDKTTALFSTEKTEVLYGEDVTNLILQIVYHAKERVNTCDNSQMPSVAIAVEPFRKAIVDAKGRGVRLRYVTEITKDNLSYCKQLSEIVELRHLDNIKGNFAITENEYLATAVLQQAKPVSQAIYSNAKSVLEQHQYLFETLWDKATPAEKKIMDIEEGINLPESKILHGVESTTNSILNFLSNAKSTMDISAHHIWPSVAMGIEVFKNGMFDLKNRKLRSRFVTDIRKSNLSYCKQLMNVGELRHLEGIKGNFAVSESEYIASAILQEAQPISQLIYSNVTGIIEQQQYVFESLWSRAIPAEQRIREIEEDIEQEFYDVIANHQEAGQILFDLAKSVKKEALILLPNDKSMVRLDRLGVIDYAIKASQQNAAEVKVICPLSQVNFEIVKRISDKAPNIKILNGNNSPYGMFIVDSQKFFRAELREPNAEQLSEAIGFTVYSNSKVSVSSFRSVFELLWNEHMLNEDLKRADEMQKEFINIAAHELRTPAQSILGFAELATTDPKYSQQQKQELFIDVIYRNAVRLHRLTKDILDVTRIESHTLYLNKELLNLKYVIANVVLDVQRQTIATTKGKVSVTYKVVEGDTTANSDTIFVEADRERITQVLHNLLDNAVKFSKDGDIVSVTVEDKNQEDTNNNEKGLQQGEVMVKVKDTGTGIHPEMLPRLFSKFATKSLTGTGLGLYISKSIVEAHGGRIWAENNTKGRGATFYFTLPLAK